ncbi:hypothetical protein ACP70R_048852 [Stipagrostis hirtigluma subsp. patula]
MQAAAMADADGGPGYLLGGLACCCASAGCYFLGKSRLESDVGVRSARRFRRICDLSTTLDSSFGHLAMVTVSGRVGSDTPIIGQQSGLQAAIVEQHVITDFKRSNTALLKEAADEEGWGGILGGKEDEGEMW